MMPLKKIAALLALLSLASAVAAAESVTLNWLGGGAPSVPDGVSWGVPWPKGAVQPNTPMRLATADGHRVDVQTWPLASWPDGSVKWSGHAIAATAGLAGPLMLTAAPGMETERGPVTEIKYADDATSNEDIAAAKQLSDCVIASIGELACCGELPARRRVGLRARRWSRRPTGSNEPAGNENCSVGKFARDCL